MSDEMRPPPLPPKVKPRRIVPVVAGPEEDTLPGLDAVEHNRQLRLEKRELQARLDAALTQSQPGLVKKQSALVRYGIVTGKWVVLLPIVAILGRAAAKQWPQFADLIDAVVGVIGL